MKYYTSVFFLLLLFDFSCAKNNSPCSDDPFFSYMIRLSDDLVFHWNLIRSNDTSSDLLEGQLTYNGLGWLAWGVSSKDNKGKMIGSNAIIGLPDDAFAGRPTPLKYNLDLKVQDGVVPMEDLSQTLTNALVDQTTETTTLVFTKLLREEGEIEILPSGENVFIYAVGNGNELLHHKISAHVSLDLSKCPNNHSLQSVSSSDKSSGGIWIMHGVFMSLAFLLATPIAVSTAWLKVFIPRTWIYGHVLGNIISLTLTLLAFFIAVVKVSTENDVAHLSKPHHIRGFCLTVFIAVQIIGGLVRPIYRGESAEEEEELEIPAEGKCKKATQRDLWRFLHTSAGLSLLILGLWQVHDGLVIYSTRFHTHSLTRAYWIYVIIFVASLILLRVRLQSSVVVIEDEEINSITGGDKDMNTNTPRGFDETSAASEISAGADSRDSAFSNNVKDRMEFISYRDSNGFYIRKHPWDDDS